VVFMSEIFPQKLEKFPQIDTWIQIACPRLSIDWGHHFPKPLLSTYEAFALFNEAKFPESNQDRYPMDFYSDEGG
jgi:2-(3-amino-3-carboxypropyl)histidine synthase